MNAKNELEIVSPIIQMDQSLTVIDRDNQKLVIVMAGAEETVVYAPAKSVVSAEITQLATELAAQTYAHKKL